MRRFIYSILLFFVPVYGTLAVIDFCLSKELQNSNYKGIESWYDLMHGKIDADVIVMGSSRAWVHVNPIILDTVLNTSTYNIGIDGSNINRQIQKYKLFRKFNRKPKVIIQNIDQNSLGYTIGYMKEQFYPYFWNISMRNIFLPTEPFTFADKYIPCYRYYHCFDFETLHGMLVNTKRLLTKGYEGKERIWDGSGLKKVKSIEFKENDTTMVMLHEYLAEAKAEGIKVVFVYTPLYYKATNKIKNIDEMHSAYKKIADKYGIPILDYMTMSLCKDTTYFYNAMHLNKKGSEIFSDSLAHDLKRLGILSQ